MARTTPAGKTAPAEQPFPTERAKLKLRVLELKREFGRTKRSSGGRTAAAMAWLKYSLARLNAWRPMRVFQLYGKRRGPLMAAGIAYNMFFSIAALLVAGFSLLGLVIAEDVRLQNVIVDAVDATTPGLIGPKGQGLATPEQLFNNSSGFGLALIVSTVVLLVTSLGWIAGIREGMRGIFDLPPLAINPVLLKLKDLAALLVLGVALVVTTAVGLVANTLLDFVFDLLRFGDGARPFTQLAGVAVMLLLDFAVAVILFRGASGIEMPRKVLFQAALIAAAGSTILRTFSTLLLGNVGRNNDLLAPFAVILGLFVWFYLLSQVYLIATAWGAIGKADTAASAQQELRGGHARSLRQRSRKAQRADAR